MTAVATLDCATNDKRLRRSAPSGTAAARHADRRRRGDLRGDDGGDRGRETVRRAGRDRREAQGHRDEEEERADVVAAAQDERDAADVLRALREREERGDQQRRRQPALVQERVGGGCEREQQARREQAARELERDRALEQAPQPAPVLPRRVAEAELDERLLDRQVEQALEEGRGGQHEGVTAEGLRRENVERDDGSEEAERCRGVRPGRGGRTAPEEPRAH
jgi:hypothetical protein